MSDVDVETLIERSRYSGPTVTADQLIGLDACLCASWPASAALFIDEVSLIAQTREYAGIYDQRMLTALPTCLDGLSSESGPERLWVIGASTPSIPIDPAARRAGRLGVVIEFV
jgi:SpoVK/Ycf46/Vps4 family AAA+-type ATPase